MGGMFGESKFDLLTKIPVELRPVTIYVKQPVTPEGVLDLMELGKLTFPLILKPDIGERGYFVIKVNSLDDVRTYLEGMKFDFLIQEMVNLPLEFGVFYKRLPNNENGNVISLVMKEMLSVVGDGHSTLKELILHNDRAKLQWHILKNKFSSRLADVIPAGEKIEVVSIGNHCLGTKFLNGNHLITPRLSKTFDDISKKVDGFFFGRYDLRCSSIEALYEGDIKVLELNGCGAEPAHIYDPDFPLLKAVNTLILHWRSIFEIARQNEGKGIRHLPFKQAMAHYQNFKDKMK